MVTLDWDVERTDGVTHVGLVVTADHPQRVRIENRLDGPVWPPRRQGQPASGWDDDGFTGVIPADGRLTLGYASSAPPADPPAEVVSTEPADASPATKAEVAGSTDGFPSGQTRSNGSGARSTDSGMTRVESTPSGVIRSLGDPVVPRDCVPVPSTNGSGGGGESGDGLGDGNAAGERPARADGPETPAGGATGDDRNAVETELTGAVRETLDGGDRVRSNEYAGANDLLAPAAVRAWLRDVERRIDAVEERTEGDREGDPVAGPVGGNGAGDEDVLRTGLGTALEADRRALACVRRRVDALASRAPDRSPGAR